MQSGKSVPVINVCGSRFVAKGIPQTQRWVLALDTRTLTPIEIKPTQGTYPVTVRYEGQAQAGSLINLFLLLLLLLYSIYIFLTSARCRAAG